MDMYSDPTKSNSPDLITVIIITVGPMPRLVPSKRLIYRRHLYEGPTLDVPGPK